MSAGQAPPGAGRGAQQGPQRQRHGVAKNLAEGIGGLMVGAALVLLLGALRRSRHPQPPASIPSPPPTPTEPES
ncbi:MAG: carbon monoxide dehydrogenase [Chromatiaceae bacterium]|nr:MAG: carbon monoxide dehydrogenase [Chromatiaceae bacterium]